MTNERMTDFWMPLPASICHFSLAIGHWSFAKSVSPLSAASEIVRKNVATASGRQPGKDFSTPSWERTHPVSTAKTPRHEDPPRSCLCESSCLCGEISWLRLGCAVLILSRCRCCSPRRPEFHAQVADDPPCHQVNEPAFAAVNLRVAAHLGLEQQGVVVESCGDEDGSARAPFVLPGGDRSDGKHVAAEADMRIGSCLQNDGLPDVQVGDFSFGDGNLRRDRSQLVP